jgi:hypothetical protein
MVKPYVLARFTVNLREHKLSSQVTPSAMTRAPGHANPLPRDEPAWFQILLSSAYLSEGRNSVDVGACWFLCGGVP